MAFSKINGFNFISLYILFLFKCIPLEAAPQDALIAKLPGFNGSFPSKHYSGYVTLYGNPQKNLFYYFVESERNSTEDPLVLWLNGGPGCSSFDGFVYEHGPFNFEPAKGGLPILHLNPYSWSKVSNVIYLDSPSGVGFSYPAANETGDIQTAKDTHAFLLKWLELYPEFISNPFYLSGESYAGVYIPTLASQIHKGLERGVRPTINLKGYMIGNGVCDTVFDGNALVPFAYRMGLISDLLYEEAVVTCKMNFHNPTDQPCIGVISKIHNVLHGLNIYDILEPCYHDEHSSLNDTKKSNLPLSFKQLGQNNERPLPVRKRMFGRAWPYRAILKPGLVPSWPQLSQNLAGVPCTNDEVATTWLNDEAVMKAIHVSPEKDSWVLCERIVYSYGGGSMISYHKDLTQNGYRALIYSGDHDMCVPFTGTQAWVQSLGYNIEDEWRPWLSNHQIAGYIQQYENNLTFLTIKGAGHTVPEYKPRESLDFYSRWLQGQKI